MLFPDPQKMRPAPLVELRRTFGIDLRRIAEERDHPEVVAFEVGPDERDAPRKVWQLERELAARLQEPTPLTQRRARFGERQVLEQMACLDRGARSIRQHRQRMCGRDEVRTESRVDVHVHPARAFLAAAPEVEAQALDGRGSDCVEPRERRFRDFGVHSRRLTRAGRYEERPRGREVRELARGERARPERCVLAEGVELRATRGDGGPEELGPLRPVDPAEVRVGEALRAPLVLLAADRVGTGRAVGGAAEMAVGDLIGVPDQPAGCVEVVRELVDRAPAVAELRVQESDLFDCPRPHHEAQVVTRRRGPPAAARTARRAGIMAVRARRRQDCEARCALERLDELAHRVDTLVEHDVVHQHPVVVVGQAHPTLFTRMFERKVVREALAT